MSYVLFSEKATKFAPPLITIRNGRISLSSGAGDYITGVGARHVHLFWDAGAHKLAIKPVKKEDEHSFRVSIPAGRRGGTLSAESFLKFIRWTCKESISMAAQWNEAEQLLEVELPARYIAS